MPIYNHYIMNRIMYPNINFKIIYNNQAIKNNFNIKIGNKIILLYFIKLLLLDLTINKPFILSLIFK